jgi:uncharacterized protein
VIGGFGMVLCWVAAYAWTPALTYAIDRRWPLPPAKDRRTQSAYGRVLAATLRAPAVPLVLAALASIAGGVAIWRWVEADPIEYDFRNLQSQSYDDPLQVINRRVAESVDEATNGSAIAVLAQSPQDARHVGRQLTRAHDGSRAFGSVRTVYDLLPVDQEQKLPLLHEIRDLLIEVRPHVDEEQARFIDENLPPEDLVVLRPEDLPETVARPFTERDGTVGTIVYVEHEVTRNQFDGRYLREWTEAARSPRNRDGSPVVVAGAAPVVADLVTAILESAPITVLASFLATVLLLLFTFRRNSDRFWTLGTHLAGVTWMLGAMAAVGMRINFLNFVALPITFGMGVEYGVNVTRRYNEEILVDPHDAARRAVTGTGGAVALCSLTTVIGYLALWTSPNRAVNSFGFAMAFGEVTCASAALLVLPAALQLVHRLRARGSASPAIDQSHVTKRRAHAVVDR